MGTKFFSWAAFFLLCLIWGSSFILMKVSMRGLSSAQIAALRIFTAGIVFLPFAIYHLTKVPRGKLWLIILNGVLGNLFPAFLFTFAISRIDSSLAGVLNSLTPIMVVVIGTFIFKEKIASNKIAGVLIGFAGLVALSLTQKNLNMDNVAFAGLVILATISYGTNIHLVARYLKDVKSTYVATISVASMLPASALLLWYFNFLQLDFSDSVVQWSLVNSVLLGLMGSAVGTVLFYFIVQKAGGIFASLVTYGVPVVAIGWGIVFGESVTAIEVICLVVILSGVFLANSKLGGK